MTAPAGGSSAARFWSPRRDAVPLTHYAALFRRHLRLLIVTVLLGALGGAGIALVKPPTYTASVSVLVSPITLSPVRLPPRQGATKPARLARDVTLDTEAQFIWSAVVLDQLARTPGFPSAPDELRNRVSITVPANTRVIVIGVRADSQVSAQRGADTVARAYVTMRDSIIDGAADRDRETLQRRVTILQRQLEVLQSTRRDPLDPVVPIRQRAVSRQLTQTQARLTELDGRVTRRSEILLSSQLPVGADDRAADVLVASGVGTGLLCGLLIAARRNARPRRIWRAADLHLPAPLSLLFESDGAAGPGEVPQRLQSILARAGARKVFIAGVPSDAAMPVAAGLAEACTETDRDTVLVDLRGVREPAPWRPGPATPGHWRVDSGNVRSRLVPVLARARATTGTTVVAGVPLDSADAVDVACACDLTVVVVAAGRAVDHELAVGLDRLRLAGASVLGLVIIHRAPPRNATGTAAEEPSNGSPVQAGFDGDDTTESRDRLASTASERQVMARVPGEERDGDTHVG